MNLKEFIDELSVLKDEYDVEIKGLRVSPDVPIEKDGLSGKDTLNYLEGVGIKRVEFMGLALERKITKREAWVNIYRTQYCEMDARFVSFPTYQSEKEARAAGITNPNYITTVPIEWEE